ncbi:DUF547 domain-containing protein [Aquimarina sp. AU474]|uniref:DUF547 domain-containing protein n=1 Tax=Aquimarina sp. AU474 TaxID=2108529 RepID=UPI000D68575D|nr:DUF547 domain-containing protein [Aquimarina sp. AU474]
MKNNYLLCAIFLVLLCSPAKAQHGIDHSVWDQILILNVTEDGKVNYEGVMKDSPLFYKYFRSLSDNPPTDQWTREEKLAYWINAYNSIAVKMIIDNYPVKDINELHDPWNQKFFRINDERLSLDDIEHKILRKFNEPRIHFLINCASFSSPKLMNRAYTSENVEEAMEKCTMEFINDPNRNIITENKISISQIFEWYKDDFNNGDVVEFINQYSEVKIEKLPKNSYMAYNWSLNEQ